VRTLRRVTTQEANDLHDGAFLTTFWNDDGSLAIHGRLAPEDAVVFLRALDAARDRLWAGKEGGSAEPPSTAETLVAVAEAALTSAPARAGGEHQVVVHVDADTLAGDDGGCALDDEAAVAPETARRLACDASVVTMSERNGRLLSVGRKTRSIPPALRRALLARDGRCRFPGCDNRFVRRRPPHRALGARRRH
jgi:hypothetical protein